MSSVYANLVIVRVTYCCITFHVAVIWIVLKLLGLNSDFPITLQNLEKYRENATFIDVQT